MLNAIEVLTIGHSSHTLESFQAMLRDNGVTAVADVRSAPYSRLYQQFDRGLLRASLKEVGIAYSFLGAELGGRPNDSTLYHAGKVAYRRVADTDQFRRGIQRVLTGAARYRVALLCAEREPLDCHRGLLIAPALEKLGASVLHVRNDGSIESHTDALQRLLSSFGLLKQDALFPKSDVVEDAYARQQRRVAYARRAVRGHPLDRVV